MNRPWKSAIVPALVGVAALALTSCAGGGSADAGGGDYSPGNSVRMIVPFAAGGGSDLAGRAIATGLEPITGATVTVENLVGGSGAVGYAQLVGSAGDASILLASETSLITLPVVQDVPFSYQDFTPIMKLAEDYNLVVVRADSPHQTCNDLVDAAADTTIGIAGTTGPDHIALSLVEQETGSSFERVNFESGGEITAALLGGHIGAAGANPGEILGQLESGDVRALCALAPERYEYPALADIPTGIEQGIPVDFAQWRGFVAPGGIPEEATEYWMDAGRQLAGSEAFTTYIEDNMLQESVAYGDEFRTYLDEYQADVESVLGDE
ncbi:tripartite tricarboxylate transporter substrate binding protein [Pseudonocardia nematodicida]|uniref:Tripartite tricarboxylate transporter substrate binding protein n=1 Tax=Pseudonocardia nematodicida TaxID=1206997 RepID=A0ABV1K7A4_9PSEU